MKNESLGEIFNRVNSTPPAMTYEDYGRIRIEFIGSKKIAAIRALRIVTGLDVRSAKNAIEWPGGFVVSPFIYAAIVEKYLADSMCEGGHGSDWREISERPEPITL